MSLPVDKVPVDKVAVDKVAVDKVAVDKVAVDKVAVDKVAVDKVAVDKVAVGKVAVDKDDAPYWIQGREFHTAWHHGDPRGAREVVAQVRELIPLRQGHRPFRWGFAILRTAFGPHYDMQFWKFLNILHRVVQLQAFTEAEVLRKVVRQYKLEHPDICNISDCIDTRPNEEICESFKNDILDDPVRLRNASVTTVRDYYRKWIKDMNGTAVAGDMRFAACIMVDAETLDQFTTTPERFPQTNEEGLASSHWLKLVDAATLDQHTTKPEDWQQTVAKQGLHDWEDLFDIGMGPNETVRVRLYGKDDFRKYWFDRNRRRLHLSEMTHRHDQDKPGVLYYTCAQQRIRPMMGINNW